MFDDADLDNAAKGVISGILAATGQTCVAGSRLLVQESIHDRFVEKVVAMFKTAKMGDPMSLDTQVGPIANKPQLEKILKYIDIAKGEGADVVIGGARASRPECGDGWFVEPTIFNGVNNSMRIAQEGSVRPGAGGHPVQGRGRRRSRSATTSSTASRPACGRRASAAR